MPILSDEDLGANWIKNQSVRIPAHSYSYFPSKAYPEIFTCRLLFLL